MTPERRLLEPRSLPHPSRPSLRHVLVGRRRSRAPRRVDERRRRSSSSARRRSTSAPRPSRPRRAAGLHARHRHPRDGASPSGSTDRGRPVRRAAAPRAGGHHRHEPRGRHADHGPALLRPGGREHHLLYPTPLTTGDTLHLLYVPRHTTLSNTADSPSSSAFGNIPAEYHVILEDYVKWKACEAEEHKPSDSGKSFQQAFAQGCTGVRAEMKKKAGSSSPRSASAAPGRCGPHSPGVDVR